MKRTLRRITALLLSALTLWIVIATIESPDLPAAWNAIRQDQLSRHILQWEIGDFFTASPLSVATSLALQQSPFLLAAQSSLSASNTPSEDTVPNDTPDDPSKIDDKTSLLPYTGSKLTFTDNGVPSQTTIPSKTTGYTIINGVYIKNTTDRVIDTKLVGGGHFSATYQPDASPQVLILHSHATEAYTMPANQSYKASGTCRTKNTEYNVVRVGDEIAAVLSSYGISVLHDRTLHDDPDYNDAYSNSYDAIESYLDKYPSLVYVLDIHRDAVEDASGQQYKLVSEEDSHAAQCSIVLGNSFDHWQDNLTLAVAVQQTLNAQHPTLMRPITMRSYRYNQQLTNGSLLVEIGAAGNSLDEALYSARLFAQGFAETILK
ncbi:MAG: stage II sporulation protein P [Eubacteriales bacterium]|nr:stage II sporulation protein P [Eubacteriales bacterium]